MKENPLLLTSLVKHIVIHTRIYIMLLIARFLFLDKSNNFVNSYYLVLLKDIDKCNRYS